MGLKEITQVGARLSREVITVSDTNTSGSILLGPTYGILNIQVSDGCRLRLYDNLESLQDSTEIARQYGNRNIPNNIALIGDFTMSLAGSYTIDPMLYGHAHNSSNTYYRINKNTATPTRISITRFLLEDPSIQAQPGTTYSVNNRRSIVNFNGNLSGGQITSGTLSDNSIPNTYLLISASLNDPSHFARLRLYSTSSTIYDNTEKLRPFSTEPSREARLIIDMVLSGSTPIYFSPKIVGANLQKLKTDLNELRLNRENIFGTNEMYYFLENLNTGGAVPLSASIYVYSLEE